jgi:hypothetical protein
MYLFSRRGRLAGGNTRKALEWAFEITEQATQVSGVTVSLYTSVFSPEAGTMAWSTFVPDMATLEAAGDKLQADDGFIASSDRGAELGMSGFDDSLFQVLHGEVDPGRSIEYVTAVQTVCANSNFARGIEVGVEIAQRAERITGNPMLFVAAVTGSFGGVGWLSGFADINAMESAQQALLADPDWLAYLDKEASAAYVEEPGTTQQLIYRRLV